MVWGTVLCVSVCSFWVVSEVGAVWIVDGETPRVVEVAALSNESTHGCAGVTTSREVSGLGEVTVCMYMGDPYVGVVLSGSSYRLVRGHAFDTKLYLVDGVCEQRLGCVYRHDRDILVEKRGEGNAYQLKVHYNVMDAMRLQFDLATGTYRYSYTVQPDAWTITTQNGASLDVRSYALSTNGRWVVAEVKNIGILRINAITQEVIRIRAPGFTYGSGKDPRHELAVNNDGTTVVVTGSNSGFAIIDTVDCGQVVSTALTSSFPVGVTHCPYSDAGMGSIAPNYRYVHHPRFMANDTLLSVERQGYGNEDSLVVFAPADSDAEVGHGYIALGDSFTSGEGEDQDSWYEAVTPADVSCHRSSRSYPFQYGVQQYGAGVVLNVACSGARLNDIWPTGVYMGQGGRLKDEPEGTIASYQQQSLANGGGGVVPQRDFVQRYQPAEVTISVGGNDVGLLAKVKACATLGTCHWAKTEFRAAVRDEIDRYEDSFKDTLVLLQEQSPRSEFRVVGYPDPLRPNGNCDVITTTLFSYDERVLLRNMVQRLNGVLYRAAQSAKVHYVDVFSATNGHQLCAPGVPAMNGFRFGDDVGPLPWLRFIGAESFHPTQLGHQLVAERLSQQKDIQHPEVPFIDTQYWSVHERLSQQYFYIPGIARYTPTSFDVFVPPNSVKPGVELSFTMRSEAIALGTVTADESGGFSGTLPTPVDSNPGYHTIEVTFESNTGSFVTLYDIIFIPSPGAEGDAVGIVTKGGLVTPDTPLVPLFSLNVDAENQPVVATEQYEHTTKQVISNSSILGVSNQSNLASESRHEWILLALLVFVGIITVWLLFVRWLRN
jgi:lysophospholipase L1-like esterase